MILDFEEALDQVGDSQKPLSIPSLYILSGATQAELSIFAERWPGIEVERRRRIIDSLVEIAEASFQVDFNPLFRLCLEDEDDQVRAQAIDGLWEDEDVALINPLVGMFKGDTSTLVRAKAAMALGRYVLLAELDELDEPHSTVIMEALLGVIRDADEDLEVRRRAVEAISFAGLEEVRDIIEAAYYDDEEKMRVSAVFAMGRSADPYWNETVMAELDNPNPEMRYEAAMACGELENAEAVPVLIPLIDDPDHEVQGAAIWALGQIGGEEARHALYDCCLSQDEVVREAAEDALAELELARGFLTIPLYEADDEGLGE